MEQKNILLLAGVLGILTFLILPTFLKIFAFLIPAITLGFTFSKKFNWILFTTLALFYILFPSSLLTLDSSQSFNVTIFTTYVTNTVQTLITVFAFVIPILGLIGCVYAFYLGNVDQGMSALIKVIATILIVSIMLFFGSMLGWELFSLDTVKPVYDWMWSTIKKIANFFTQTIPTFFGFDADTDLKMLDDVELLSVIDSPKTLSLTIGSIYPIILSIITILIAFVLYITKYQIKKSEEKDSQRFNRPNQLDFSFLIFIIIILVLTFILYLTYDFESFMNYQNIGFFTIYILMTAIFSVFLVFGIGSPTKLSKETIYGTIIGVALLFLYANMFTQVQTFDMMNLEYSAISTTKILSQFLFVAPTESLTFHVFLPSLIIFYYLRQNRVLSQSELDFQMFALKQEIKTYENTIPIIEKTNNIKELVKKTNALNKRQLKLMQLEKTIPGINTEKITTQNFIVFLAFSFICNLIFSLLHFFKSGLTFVVFWTSGLGFLYLSSGMILTLISYRYGWLSGILSHAIHNSLTLYLIAIMGGI